MDSRGRSSNSSHSSDQFNLYGEARDRTHYQRANAFISNAFSFLGHDNFDAYKYYEDDNGGQAPILHQQRFGNPNPNSQPPYPQHQYDNPQFPQQPYPKRMSESSPGTLKQQNGGSSGLTWALIAVIVFLVLAIIGVVLGVVFGIVLKSKEHKFTSTINTNEPWDAELGNKGSEAYKNMNEKMRDALNKAFELSQLNKYSKPKQEIQGFRDSTSGSTRKKRAAAATLCIVRTSFSSSETPSISNFRDDVNSAFSLLKHSNKIDLDLSVLEVSDTSSSTGTATTTTQATTLVSRSIPIRATPAPVTCTPAATAGVQPACIPHTGNVGFPNAWGHKTAAETADAYEILKAVADTNCMPEAEKFICTLLFNPCSSSKLKVPCKKFCTDFAAKCSYPLLCSGLPDSDDPNFCVASAAQSAVQESTPPYDFTCPTGQEICGVEPNCFASNKKCDGTEDCPDGFDELNCDSLVTFRCDFETDFCSFVLTDAKNHFEWKRQAGPSPSPYTGPFIDHTKRTNAGRYMYAEASGRYFKDNSVVWTPSQNIQTESCLQFYYHMRGQDVYKLEVLLERNSEITTPWFQTGNHDDYWLLGRVQLTPGQVKIGFQATMSGGYQGDIAIDDITIKKEACKNWNCETNEKRVGLFSCGNSNCVLNSYKCNGVDDCGNYNEERSCVCSRDQFKCGIGMCIASRRRCDGIIDCPDRADEMGCRCPKGQILCADNSTCIMKEWQCDHQVDCPGGDDEQSCRTCTIAQWQCRDYSCISRNNRCDGTAQCLDKSDEENCVQLDSEQVVMVTRQAESYPVCNTSLPNVEEQAFCQELGLGEWISSDVLSKSVQQYVHIESGSGSIISRSLVNTSCADDKVLKLSCENKECGKSFANEAAVTYIINGQDAAGGRWPWQVALFQNDQFTCGGVIINSRQIATAAHCITSLSTKAYQVMAGSPKLQGADPNRVYRQVKAAFLHDSFNYQFFYKGGDIAILTLEGFLPFNNFIQPICLPESSDVFHTSSTCYSAGWGFTDYEAQTLTNDLKEAKLKIVTKEKCLAGFPNLGDGTFCAGYDSGYIANCRGDSGGPLMCLGSDRRWKLAGIYVIFATGCNIPERPPVFTDVVHYLTWLKSKIECEYKCTNNRCIFTRDLCDGTDDCGDNSDEGTVCDNPAHHDTSCTFENSYNCGYKSYGKSNFKSVQRKQGAIASNKGPTADKTLGTTAGHYIYAASGPALFMGPAYSSQTAQCLTFYYLMRGTSSTLQVIRHPLAQGTTVTDVTINNQKTVVQTIASTSATGTWQFAKVDLVATASGVNSEVLGFEFTGTAPNIAIDEVKLHSSTCSALACKDTEFQCTDKSDCVSEESKCNFVKQCADNSDEAVANCPANKEIDQKYRCTFEDINLCGIKQQTDEASDWKLGSTTTSVETTGISGTGPPGHYLYTDLSASTNTDTMSATFSIDLELRAVQSNTKLCAEFLYWATTSGFLQVVSVDTNGAKKVTKIFNSINQQWNTQRIHLSYDVKQLQFQAYTTSGQISGNHNFIAIDDISITHGPCGCADDEMFCDDGIHCFEKGNLCMGQNECPDGSDNPFNCTCDASMNQFECANGKCIPINRRCNTNDDCGDESDERNCTRCNEGDNGNFLCSDGYCLKSSFKCDGVKDCSNDEEGCCQPTEFECSTNPATCIAMSKLCDGNFDCSDKSDELRCARLGKIGDQQNILQIREGDQWHPVCAAGWNSALNPSVCTVLGLGSTTSSSSTVTLAAGQSYYSYSGTETTFKPHLFNAATSCSTNQAVALICSESGPPCGFRNPEALSPVAFIVGGTIVSEGSWPWVGYLTHSGEYQCSGSLVSDQWFLTAAHCILGVSPSLHGVVLGTTKLEASTSSVINAEVEKVVKHPDYATDANNPILTQNDIALVKLKNKITFSLSANRICFPDTSETFGTLDHCFLAGWGYSNPARPEAVEDLRQLRMTIVADADCKSPTNTAIHDHEKQLCAGYTESVSGTNPSPCLGDSGGALMCKKSGLWKVVGTVSWGLADCAITQPTVFTKVSHYKSWIDSTMTDNSNANN